MSDIRYSIALTMLQDIGPVGSRKLLSAFGTTEKIFHSTVEELAAMGGIGMNRARNIKAFSSWHDVEKQVSALEKSGIRAVSLEEPFFPELLREIDDAPVVLYMRGDIEPRDRYALAVVGSRKPSSYGAAVTERISGDLASMGFCIVSGMARGIDALSRCSVQDLMCRILPRTKCSWRGSRAQGVFSVSSLPGHLRTGRTSREETG
jgi:DNA processing protein